VRSTQTRNPETGAIVWIPGSREDARPGMTVIFRHGQSTVILLANIAP
jgi:hypothetical protein